MRSASDALGCTTASATDPSAAQRDSLTGRGSTLPAMVAQTRDWRMCRAASNAPAGPPTGGFHLQAFQTARGPINIRPASRGPLGGPEIAPGADLGRHAAESALSRPGSAGRPVQFQAEPEKVPEPGRAGPKPADPPVTGDIRPPVGRRPAGLRGGPPGSRWQPIAGWRIVARLDGQRPHKEIPAWPRPPGRSRQRSARRCP